MKLYILFLFLTFIINMTLVCVQQQDLIMSGDTLLQQLILIKFLEFLHCHVGENKLLIVP